LSLLARFANCGVSRLMLFPQESVVFRSSQLDRF